MEKEEYLSDEKGIDVSFFYEYLQKRGEVL